VHDAMRDARVDFIIPSFIFISCKWDSFCGEICHPVTFPGSKTSVDPEIRVSRGSSARAAGNVRVTEERRVIAP